MIYLKKMKYNNLLIFTYAGGGIGRHKGLKIPRQQWRAGSSPAPGHQYKVSKKNL